MILVALGANLASPVHGPPEATLEAALAALDAAGITILKRSPWYRSAPVPRGDQPWYINGVASVRTALGPDALLAQLHRIEQAFGRTRRERNEPRVLDLDLLDYDGMVRQGGGAGPALPHPRMHERAFVLLPLRDVAPDWRHPVTGTGLAALIAALPEGQQIERIP